MMDCFVPTHEENEEAVMTVYVLLQELYIKTIKVKKDLIAFERTEDPSERAVSLLKAYLKDYALFCDCQLQRLTASSKDHMARFCPALRLLEPNMIPKSHNAYAAVICGSMTEQAVQNMKCALNEGRINLECEGDQFDGDSFADSVKIILRNCSVVSENILHYVNTVVIEHPWTVQVHRISTTNQ